MLENISENHFDSFESSKSFIKSLMEDDYDEELEPDLDDNLRIK